MPTEATVAFTSPAAASALASETFIVQTASGNLSAEQALASLSTGIVKVATGTGVLSTATAGTDYSAGTASLATGLVKSTTTSGALSIGVAGTDYQAPITDGTDLTFTGNTLNHDDTAVTPGTYTSVTVNQRGHVTGGTNPAGTAYYTQLTWGCTTTTDADFLSHGGALVPAGTTETIARQHVATRAMTLTNIRAIVTTNPGGSDTTVFTVVKNGSDTALVATVASGDTTASGTGSISVAAGDTLAIKVTFTGSNPGISVVCVGGTAT